MKTRFLATLAIVLCLFITFTHGIAAGAVCAVAAGAAMSPMQWGVSRLSTLSSINAGG